MNMRSWIRRTSILVVISSVVSPLLAVAATDNATLTVGGFAYDCGGFPEMWRGYFPSPPTGSYSPTSLTGGKTALVVMDVFGGCGSFSQVSVSGFSSNPGSSWLTSMTCNGGMQSGTAAGFYYSGGIANWTWSALFGLPSSGSVGCSMVHN